ncbi:hypothetical protein K435DRAFT_475155 [Dendrothele bispora CBS 962.96]|uniref:Uncharacterized protein n=1 Tax=Dendrothele bispora (strain CBS 962.96) TaxID=1314807 RepID=A0A4S8KZG7_DENBC|nr:hypothetical protein K435DRAFT_475155 [Dendrothele bispora CBS 962.96]
MELWSTKQGILGLLVVAIEMEGERCSVPMRTASSEKSMMVEKASLGDHNARHEMFHEAWNPGGMNIGKQTCRFARY